MVKFGLKIRIYIMPVILLAAMHGKPAASAEKPQAEPWTLQPANTFVLRTPYYLTSEPGFVWDSVNRVFLGWGGHHLGQEQSHDVWALNPAHGAWRCMHPGLSPRADCCAPQFSFDAHFGRMLSFGGDGDQSHGWMAVTVQGFEQSVPYAYDYAANRWTAMRPYPEPPGGVRQYKGFAYHPGFRTHVLFSGGNEQPSDAWAYDASANEWTELTPEGMPQGRKGHVLCYDPERRALLMHGGRADDRKVYKLSLEKNRWSVLDTDNEPPLLFAPIFTYDPHARSLVLAGVFNAAGKNRELQVWQLAVGERTWTKVVFPETGEVPGRQHALSTLGFAGAYSPELNLYLFSGGTFGHNQFHTWTYRLAPTRELTVPAPLCAKLLAEKDGIKITWKAVPDVAGYEVQRGIGDQSWKAQYQKLAQTQNTSFTDTSLTPGIQVFYRIRAIPKAPGDPVAEDLVTSRLPAPAAPLVHVESHQSVRLALPQASPGSAGFLIERAPAWTSRFTNQSSRVQIKMKLGTFELMTQEPHQDNAWRDTLDLSKVVEDRRFEAPENPICALYPKQQAPEPAWNPLTVYAYRIREVNKLGVISGPSPWVTTLPTAPNPVTTVALGVDAHNAGLVTVKWQQTGQENIAGYRVYRQLTKLAGPVWQQEWAVPHHADPGRWHKLSREDIRATEFLDDTIPGGLCRRRYYVTAIDRFGQQGPPSTGAWAYRAETFPAYEPVKATPRALVPELDAAIEIDGAGKDEAWSQAQRFVLHCIDGRKQPPAQPTEVRLFTRKGLLYGIAHCSENHTGELLKHEDWPRDSNYLWKDDTVEFSFITNANGTGSIHHLMLSAGPCHRDEYGPLGKRDKKAWEPEVVKAVCIEKECMERGILNSTRLIPQGRRLIKDLAHQYFS